MAERQSVTIPRMVRWTPPLHQRFLEACNRLGGPHKATPKQILVVMNVQGVTLNHIKSHLQKHRTQLLDKEKDGRHSVRVKTEGSGSDESGCPSTETPLASELERCAKDNRACSSAGHVTAGGIINNKNAVERRGGGSPSHIASGSLPIMEPQTLADYGQQQDIPGDIRMEPTDLHSIEDSKQGNWMKQGAYGRGSGEGGLVGLSAQRREAGALSELAGLAKLRSMGGMNGMSGMGGTIGMGGMNGMGGMGGMNGFNGLNDRGAFGGLGAMGGFSGSSVLDEAQRHGGLEATIAELHMMYDEVNCLKGRLSAALNTLVRYNQQALDTQRASKAIAVALAQSGSMCNTKGPTP